MNDFVPHRFGPSSTPLVIKVLIYISSIATLLFSLVDPLFINWLQMRGPKEWLMLSWWGISNLFIWQPLTYIFIQDMGPGGIQFFTLISLFFNMYILWILGTSIVEFLGQKKFLKIYFFSGIFAGLIALFTMWLTGHYIFLGGNSAALLALFTLWTMLHAETQLFLFFLFPIQAKWLLGGLLIGIALVGLSQWDLVSTLLYYSGALFGYLYGIIALNLQGPFDFTRNVDRRLRKFSKKKESEVKQTKVYNLKGEVELDDEAFMDQMLTKISKHGESALTYAEKRRMDNIARKRSH